MKKIFIILLAVISMSSVLADVISITVPYPPGGATDVWARLIAKQLTQELGNEYIVKNKPGAEGRLAVESILQQPADGRNLIVAATGPFLFNKLLFKKLNYDYTEFDAIVPMATVPIALSVGNHLKVTNLKEFVALAQTRPLNCAGSGGNSVFIGRHIMSQIKSKEVQFIPFKGSADMNMQLAAGNIDCAFDTMLAALPLHQANKFKIIATGTQSQVLPNTDLFKSVVPGLVFNSWFGIGVRVNSPGTDQLFQALRKINQDPEFQAAAKRAGFVVTDPVEHGSQWIHQEYIKYEMVREKLNIVKE